MALSTTRYDIEELFYHFNSSLPSAYSHIKGSPIAPSIMGQAYLYQLSNGVYITVIVTGIPTTNAKGVYTQFHGFHIHDKDSCEIGDESNPFIAAGGHWNPKNTPHPNHVGDLPPLLAPNGTAMLSVYTPNFTVREAIGKTFIIHEGVDDFSTQPAGNSGQRLACGIIRPYINPDILPQSRRV